LLGPSRLRQLAVLAVAAALLGGCSAEELAEPPGPEGASGARVTRHTDGDTVWLSGIGKVRLIGVDTPEVFGGRECFGRRASAFTARVLRLGRPVRYRLGVEERDRYGRALAYVWLEDGRMFNELLVERGYAQPLTIPPNDEFAARFLAAARRARERRLGLWRACPGGG
jgi:micrococcal nuclease